MLKTLICIALISFLTACGGKYYNVTSNGIKVKADTSLYISVLNPNCIYVSEKEGNNFVKNSQFNITENESQISLVTSAMNVRISNTDYKIDISNDNGSFNDADIKIDGKFILSKKGFGKFWDQHGFYLISGKNIDSVICTYYKDIKKVPLLPKWALGHWQGTENVDPVEIVKKFREANFGVDNVISLAGKNNNIEELKNLHAHLALKNSSDNCDAYWFCKPATKKQRTYLFDDENCVDSGDDSLNWNALESSIKNIITYSVGMNPYCCPIINDKFKDNELKERWYQFSVFTPIVCSFADCSSFTYYNKLRYGLTPYIYSLCGKTFLNGTPLITPIDSVSDQYMFGPSFMVCPVYNKLNTREVYLPKGGIWYDYNHPKKFYEGGQTITTEVEPDRIPVYIPGGAILIYGQRNRYVGEINKDDRVDLDIDIYSGADNSFEIYDDDGSSEGYKNGEYSIVPVQYIDNPRTIIIGTRKGKYNGMIPNRNVHVAIYDKGTMKAINVYYEGAKIKISL